MTTLAATLLVVDDDDAGRYVKVHTLRRAGFQVTEAATGTEGLALVETASPDLLILDVNLPDISGLEVTRRIRASESGPPTLQILQISNTAVEPADRVRGLDQGADVYLTEPVDAAVLVATVHALLRVRRAEAAQAAALEGERRARESAETANRLKDEFIATLSHELRTPLNALMGWIWQLRNSTLTPEARERALDSIERNARMQAQLINDLLDVSRASKGKLRLEIRMVDLSSVITAALESLRDSVARKHLDLQLNLSSVWVAGDQARLQQIVTNLLTNAVQFTPGEGRITVTAAADGDDAVVRVQDTGAGIDPAFLPHVFEQFRQGEEGLSRKHGGLGLGLAVVKQLIDLHGGTVAVTSPGVGEGSTFTIRLPRASVSPGAREGFSSRLLLEELRVALITDPGEDPGWLSQILEAAGARVAVRPLPPDTASPSIVPDCEVVVCDRGHGELSFRVPASIAPEARWQSLPRSAQPAEIVRRIAQVTTLGRPA